MQPSVFQRYLQVVTQLLFFDVSILHVQIMSFESFVSSHHEINEDLTSFILLTVVSFNATKCFSKVF